MRWLPEGINNKSSQWWAEIFRLHDQELKTKVRDLLEQALITEIGCMELGTQDVPARIQWQGRRIRAYQLVAWSYANEIPMPKRVVRHLCNNRACIKPTHLKVGLQVENIMDQKRPTHNSLDVTKK